jgi:hypothetical protein
VAEYDKMPHLDGRDANPVFDKHFDKQEFDKKRVGIFRHGQNATRIYL